MLNEKREKLHKDIFRMYAAACESLGNRTYDAPIEVGLLKQTLTGGDAHTTEAFDIEISYLIKKGLFQKYVNNRVIATTEGIDEILGKTAFSGKTINKVLPWYDLWWVKYITFPIITLIVGTFILYLLGYI